MPRFLGLCLAVSVLCGCSGLATTTSALPNGAGPGSVGTFVVQRGHGNREGSSFALGAAPAGGIVPGPDGRLWFGTLARPGSVSESGTIAMLAQDSQYAQLSGGFSRGPAGDKHVWFTEVDRIGEPAIARITPPATITLFPLFAPIAYVVGIAAGPDGAMYGAGLDSIVRMTIDGSSVLNYPLPRHNGPNPAPQYSGRPIDLTLGPDGAMWFTMPSATYIGRFDPVSKRFSSFLVPARDAGSITSFGGALYFTAADPANDYYLAKLTVDGGFSRIALPGSSNHYLQSMTVGPDGNLWVGGSGLLWTISPLGAVGGPFALVGVTSGPNAMAAGPDGNLWCLDESPQAILVYELHTLTVSATSLQLKSGASELLTASESTPAGAISATSLANQVATVTNQGSGNFVVNAVGLGRTVVRVSDAKHNFVDVAVSVSP